MLRHTPNKLPVQAARLRPYWNHNHTPENTITSSKNLKLYNIFTVELRFPLVFFHPFDYRMNAHYLKRHQRAKAV